MVDDLKLLILWFLRHSNKQILTNISIRCERQVVSPQELQPGKQNYQVTLKILKTTRNISTA